MTAPIPPFAPDDRGESDFAFFSRRPGVSRRIRLSIDGEFPPEVMEEARGRTIIVMVAVGVNANGHPTRARAFAFNEIAEGHA